MEIIGKYKIDGELGKGGMGTVYKAWHPGLGIYVALKVIQDTRFENEDLLERFKLEGQALAKLRHQNIVQIYDADQADGVHFIVMEFMNGGSLDQLVVRRDGSVPLAKRVNFILPVCHALDYAHKRKLFHRDIKPANIMLHLDGREETVKLVDFGIARLLDSSHTQTRALVGTAHYMAPELIVPTSKANERTDIWAVGVTLYELIAYRRPFQGKSLEELTRSVLHDKPRPLTQFVPDCPKDLAAVVEKALQKQPAARYQTVEELLTELEPIAKRLRSEIVGSLIRRAKDLLEIGDFESAGSIVNEAKQYDSTDFQVKSLLQKVEEELKRKELLPRLQDQVRAGRNFLDFGQFREARTAAEQAIGLDSRYEPARKLLADIQASEALAEEIEQKLNFAKRYYEQGELTEASKLVDDVLNFDAADPEAAELRVQIQSRREEFERRRKLNKYLRDADELLIVGKYDECLSLVEEALKEFPANTEVTRRKETALSEKAEQLRVSLLNKARKRRISQQFEPALETLDELLTRFPGDSAAEALRSAVQQDREQESLNLQLSMAWEDLRSLKRQGKYDQALNHAKELAVKYSSEARFKEFANELEAEINVKERESQLNAAATHIEELLRANLFDQAVSMGENALKRFPDNSSLLSLLEEAKAYQRQAEIQERLKEYLSGAHQFSSQANFKAALELVRKGLVELGEHPELRAELEQAEAGYASQLKKDREQQRTIAEITKQCAKPDSVGAGRILQNAVRDGLVQKDTPLHAGLLQEIQKAKETERANREFELEKGRRQVRDAFDRKDFAAVIRLSNDLERALGPDRENSDLRRASESAVEAQRIAQLEKDELVQKVSELLDSNNIDAANLMLHNNLHAGLLDKSDAQVSSLLSRIEDQLRRNEERKTRLQKIAGNLRDLLRAGKFTLTVESGQRALAADGPSEEIEGLVQQAVTALAKEKNLQKRRLAELQTVQSLLQQGDAVQAKTVIEGALNRGVFDIKDPEISEFKRQVEESIRRRAASRITAETEPEQFAETPLDAPKKENKKRMAAIGGILTAILVAVGVGLTYYSRRVPPPFPPTVEMDRAKASVTVNNDQVFWDQAEDAMRRSPKDFKLALDNYQKVADLHGAHESQARPKIAEIKSWQKQEETFLQRAQEALVKPQPDYSSAMALYKQVIDMDGDRKADAQVLMDRAAELTRGKDPAVLAQEDLNNADIFAADGKWENARKLYQQVKSSPGVPSNLRVHAASGFTKADLHMKEEDLWKRALFAESQNLLTDARTLLERVVGMDLNHKVEATAHIRDIDSRITAENAEKAWVDLKGRLERAQNSQSQNTLLALQKELAPIVNANGPHSAEAKVFERGISDNVAKLNAEAEWESVAEQYKGALATGDKTSLTRIASKLKPFMTGTHATDAKLYADNVEKLLTATPPPAPVPASPAPLPAISTTTAPVPSSDDAKISQRLRTYKEAFEAKDRVELRSVWPALTDKQFKDLAGNLQAAKSIQLKLNCAKPQISGTNATQSCDQVMDITIEGTVQRLNNGVTFYWRKLGTDGDWVIDNLKKSR